MLSQVTGLPAVFVRKQAKTYGTCQLAEGGEIDGQRLCIIEDVVTSGGAILDAATELRAARRANSGRSCASSTASRAATRSSRSRSSR